MPVPTLVTDLSTTVASNSPAGSDNVFPDLDNYLRALSGFVASIRDNSGNGWVSPYLPLTYSAGTANGVVYLNGSKVVTTGSGLVFDGSNLGLGVTPSAWVGDKALQVSWGSVSSGYEYSVNVSSVAYRDNTTWKYLASSQAPARYEQIGGAHKWFSAATGTAGNAISFTQAMTLDASGNLLVGLSFPAFVSTRLEVQAATNNNALGARTTQNNYAPLMAWNSATTGDNLFQYFYTEGTLTLRGSIDYNRAGGLVRYNTTSDYRAKDIIGPVQNPGATIDALKVYEGKMKGATQSRPMLVAHEAQAVAPYAVSGVKDEVNEDGTPKFQQIDVSSLVPLLLAEIQSLRARVAALEAA